MFARGATLVRGAGLIADRGKDAALARSLTRTIMRSAL